MTENILYISNILLLIILCILALANNIRMNNLTPSWNYNTTNFEKLKTVVNIFNYSRFIYLPILYILFKHTDNKLYSMFWAFIILLIQTIIQIIIYNLISKSTKNKK